MGYWGGREREGEGGGEGRREGEGEREREERETLLPILLHHSSISLTQLSCP